MGPYLSRAFVGQLEPNGLMTVPAFFQVLFLMMLQFAEERNGPEEENEEHASCFFFFF